jgi:hypothetical protein
LARGPALGALYMLLVCDGVRPLVAANRPIS